MLQAKEAEIRGGGIVGALPKYSSINEKRTEEWLTEKVAASQKEPFSEIVTLTPSLANLLLTRNDDNRPISELKLDNLKRDILADRWEFNGETIVISKEGKLNDGQHRCRAVAETGKAIRITIVFGVQRESRFTLDQGINRTVAHYLGMKGIAKANYVSTVASYIWMHKEVGYISMTWAHRPTKSETLLVASHYKDIPDSIEFVSRPGSATVASIPALAFCHWAIRQKSAETPTDYFFDRLIQGDNLSRGDPILYARQRLREMKGKGFVNDRIELIFRAWNLHRAKQEATRIMITGGKLPKIER